MGDGGNGVGIPARRGQTRPAREKLHDECGGAWEAMLLPRGHGPRQPLSAATLQGYAAPLRIEPLQTHVPATGCKNLAPWLVVVDGEVGTDADDQVAQGS